ncbi:MAG TPA: hypothetical protein VFO52_11330 [Longimicrobiales bacterium]|nr:hypothetical protein [Longimicrobiales bacterium]
MKVRRIFRLGALALLFATSTLHAQSADFDFERLQLPAGFLDLSDVTLVTDAYGVTTVTAKSRLGNAEALVLASVRLPVAGSERSIVLGIKPVRWSITEAIPALSNPVLDNLTFSNVALIISDQDIERHSSTLEEAEFEFYQEVYKSEEFTLRLTPGINLIAAIPAEGLEPGHPLITVMDALGIEKGTILLQGTLGKSLALLANPGAGGASALKDLYLRAELPPMRPAGSPEWFRSGQLALELTGAPSVRLVGEMNVLIDEEELQFFLAAALAKSGMSLAGGLNSTDGWEQPFGIPWLVLNNITLALGVSPAGITPGFAAKMVIGEKDIDVAISMTFTPTGVPSSMMFKGESQAGFGVSDLIKLQTNMAAARDAALKASGNDVPATPAIPVDALPDIEFRKVGLQFAPKDAPELNVEKGMKIKGELWLAFTPNAAPTNFASVDVGVTEDGMWARGHVNEFTLGPLEWKDAELDLTLTREARYLMMKGDVALFGARQAIDLALTKDSLRFRSQTELFDMFSADISVRSVFNLQRPDFQVDAIVSADFGNVVGPLFQQGMVAFVGAAGDVLAVAGNAARAAEQALAIPEATVEQLRNAIEAQRAIALSVATNAANTAAVRRNAMNAAWTARNNAWNYYYGLPFRPPLRKSQALATYHSWNATYMQRAVAYNASMALYTAAQRIYVAIPPANQNIHLLRAEAAIAELRGQLQTLQNNLAAMERQFALLEAALARGEQLLVIERAEFHGGLQSAMNGSPIRWDIYGAFAGEPFEIHQTMDFSNVGDGAARLVQNLLQ